MDTSTAPAPATPVLAAPELERHLAEFQNLGYTILPNAHPRRWVDAVRARFETLRHEVPHAGDAPYFFDDFLEYEPDLGVEAMTRPVVLQVAEAIIGPQVQLESMTISGSPPDPNRTRSGTTGRVAGWHRDLFARLPVVDGYQPPLLFNAMTYLQNLTDAVGPLRVIPGSHRRPSTVARDQLQQPHADELLLYPQAGDAVLFHHALLHSGTENTSAEYRFFYCCAYNLCWLKHRANYAGPICAALKAAAAARHDRRLLRLMDGDDRIIRRVLHNPVLEPEEQLWARWEAEDAAAAAGAAS